MPVTPISLGLRSNPARSGADGAARIINGYAEDTGDEGKLRYPIYACEGFTSFGTVSSGGVTRALLNLDGVTMYGVSNQRLFHVNQSGTVTDMGTFATSGTVTMARNRRTPNPQVWVSSSDGLNRLIDTGTNVVTTPTMPDPSIAYISVSQIDGYFVLIDDSGEWYISAIDDSAVDELDFAKAESSPDGLVVSKTRGSDLVLFGSHSTEFWSNTGNTDFPFERASAASFGCLAAGTAVEITMGGAEAVDSVIFAATNADGGYLGVCALSGYQAQKISTHAVDRAVSAETAANLKAFAYSINGHTFYTISGAAWTWTYDTTTGLWHERQSASLTRWRISEAAQFGSKLIVGDYTSGALYQMTQTSSIASDSVVNLYHSDDNGTTYVGPRSKTIGQSASTKQRFKWNRLGQSGEDGKVFKFEITNAINENGTGVPMTIIPPHVHAFPNPMRFNTLYADVIPASSQNTRAKAITGLAVDAYAVKG